MITRRLFAVSLLLCLLNPALPLYAQVVTVDGPVLDPSGRNWKVIKALHYDIVYPDSMSHEARRVAATLDRLYLYLQQSLRPPRNYRFTIILEPNNFTANGYVSILPRVSLYYSLPFAAEGSDWYTLLAVHEGRHMIQFDAIEQGTIRLLTLLFGEQGLIPAFSAPAWIFEGDAVVTETLLTKAGRGRDPAFTLLLKSMLLDGDLPSYQTAILGSYRRKGPTAYDLGYLLYTYLRENYTPEAADSIFSSIADIPLPLLGSFSGVHEVTGQPPRTLYRKALEEFGEFWRLQTEILPQDSYTALTATKQGDYRSYRNLVQLGNGNLAAVRSSLSRGTEIEILTLDGVRKQGLRANPASRLSAGGPFLAWDGKVTDTKYDRSANRIILYSLETGQKQTLLPAGRYFHPQLSRDGEQLALLCWNEDFSGELQIAETATGRIILRVPLPAGEFWYGFDWSADGKSLLYLKSGGTGELRFLDIESRQSRTLRVLKEEIIYDARFAGAEGVVYSSSWSGIPSIYRLNSTGEPELLHAAALGRFSPLIDATGNTLYFIDYTGSRGAVIGKAPLPAGGLPALQDVPVMREDFYLPLLAQEPGAGMFPLEEEPSADYSGEEYSFIRDGTRLHSWTLLPTSFNPVDRPEIGLTLRADTLGRLSSHELNSTYNLNDKSLAGEYAFTLRRYRPDITLRGRTRNPASDAEVGLDLEVGLPWGKTLADSYWRFEPTVSAGIETVPEEQATRFPVTYGLTAGTGTGYGPRSLQPRFGAELGVDYLHEPADSGAGYLLSGRSLLFLPGFFFNHGLSLGTALEQQEGGKTSLVRFARGWEYRSTQSLAAVQTDYRLPLAYPDLALGGAILFKRLRGGLFYDYFIDTEAKTSFSSTGAEINLDFNLLQLPVEFSVGLRGYYRLEDEGSGLQLLILGASL